MREFRLANDALEIAMRPDNGADIVRIVDRRTGVDVLFHAPWAESGSYPAGASYTDSKTAWLARYEGGWQVLCPNAGAERVVDGAVWGFHGEAAVAPWEVLEADDARAVLETRLFTAPVRLRREVELSGSTVAVREELANESGVPVEVVWMHHPGFGAPLVGAGARLYCGARTFVADADAPGDLLAPDSVHLWPVARDIAGADLDLTRLPGPEEPREVFGCLTDFERPFFAIVNERIDLGVAMRWPAEAFPHAWLWQEVHATTGFPWFRRAYVVGVEPSAVLPGSGTVAGRRRGGGIALGPGKSRTALLELTTFRPAGEVTSVGPNGDIETAGS